MPVKAPVAVTRTGNELATAGDELATWPAADVTDALTVATVLPSAVATGATGFPLAGGDGADEPAPLPVGAEPDDPPPAGAAGDVITGTLAPESPLPVAAVLDEASERSGSPAGAAGVGADVPVSANVIPPGTAIPGDEPPGAPADQPPGTSEVNRGAWAAMSDGRWRPGPEETTATTRAAAAMPLKAATARYR
jgi:hypothetical protein